MNEPSPYKISFCGDGKTLFKIWIANLLLTICTLGIYYPWGRANMKKYLYSSTYLGDHSFEFIHGSRRYRMSKTSYRGIRFGYRGNKKTLVLQLFEDALLTLITLGIYYPWLVNNARKYIYSNTRFGNISFNFNGKDSDYDGKLFGGLLLCVFTLGIYYFWYKKVC